MARIGTLVTSLRPSSSYLLSSPSDYNDGLSLSPPFNRQICIGRSSCTRLRACQPTHQRRRHRRLDIYIYIWRDNESEPEPSAFPRAVFRVEQGPVCTVQHTSSSSTVQIDPTSLHHRNLLISLHRAFYKPFDYVSIHWKKWEINGKTGMTKEILFFLERDETWSLLEATIFNQIALRNRKVCVYTRVTWKTKTRVIINIRTLALWKWKIIRAEI